MTDSSSRNSGPIDSPSISTTRSCAPSQDKFRVNLSLFLRPARGFRVCLARNAEVARMDIQKDLVAEYDRETAGTRKVLEAIPEGADFSWKPHDKSMALGRLAGHVADTAGDWAV